MDLGMLKPEDRIIMEKFRKSIIICEFCGEKIKGAIYGEHLAYRHNKSPLEIFVMGMRMGEKVF